MVKTYLCHHKNGFKVKDKVAALQIQELWTDGIHDVLECQNHRGVFVEEVQLSILWTYLHLSCFGPVTAGSVMPAGKSLKTAVVWFSLSDLTTTSLESELHIQVLQLTNVAVSPGSALKTEAVLWHQCMQESPSLWEVSMHKHPLLSFAACLLSSVFSPYTATLPYIVKSSVLLQKQTEGNLWQPWS